MNQENAVDRIQPPDSSDSQETRFQDENGSLAAGERNTSVPQKRRGKAPAWIIPLVALFVLIADQATKYAVVRFVGIGGQWSPSEALAPYFSITAGVNTGGACGYFPQFGQLFAFAPFVIMAIVIVFYLQQKQPGWLLTLGTGLIMGGALGNLVDRLRFGYVVDFIYIFHWPVFNIADAAVSTAVVLLLFWSLREDATQQATSEGTGAAPARTGVSWKLMLSFLVLLGIVAVLGVFVCVVLPSRLF